MSDFMSSDSQVSAVRGKAPYHGAVSCLIYMKVSWLNRVWPVLIGHLIFLKKNIWSVLRKFLVRKDNIQEAIWRTLLFEGLMKNINIAVLQTKNIWDTNIWDKIHFCSCLHFGKCMSENRIFALSAKQTFTSAFGYILRFSCLLVI